MVYFFPPTTMCAKFPTVLKANKMFSMYLFSLSFLYNVNGHFTEFSVSRDKWRYRPSGNKIHREKTYRFPSPPHEYNLLNNSNSVFYYFFFFFFKTKRFTEIKHAFYYCLSRDNEQEDERVGVYMYVCVS